MSAADESLFDPPALRFPDGLDRAGFLRSYWQKKPLIWRQAMADFDNPLSADELAGLACEPDVESRIVRMPANNRYELAWGPFDAAFFNTLGDKNWTLLVQDVDKHLPDLAAVLDRFDFIASWRIDDLMISFGAPGGSVGPHVDAYDVFLLQAAGERDWFIGDPLKSRTQAHPDLALVEPFAPVLTARLGPGDLLYLPPHVPHHGLAVDPCLTWSIGFRAPSLRDMVVDLSGWRAERIDADSRYEDPDAGIDEAQPGYLSGAAIARVRASLETALQFSDAEIASWFGAHLTETKPWLVAATDGVEPNIDNLPASLTAGTSVTRNGMTRWAWTRATGTILLFVDGSCRPQPDSLRWLVSDLCASRTLPRASLARALACTDGRELLAGLIRDGKLHLLQDKDADNNEAGR